MTEERGIEWGFTDDCEASARPMTTTEYVQWFGKWQGRAMLAFKLMENLVRIDDLVSYLTPEEKRDSTWVI